MLRYLARTPGVTRHDENSLLLSFSPSTGNISVVKEIVDKLLKGYDVRLRPDFGGTVRAGQGRAGAGLGQSWGCSVSVLAPGLPTQHRECSPHTSPAPTSLCPPPSHFFPSLTVPLLPSSLQTLDCHGVVFLRIFCHSRDTQLFLCSKLSSITSSLIHFCSQYFGSFPCRGSR